MQTKQCNQCQETKTLGEFYKKNGCRFGVAPKCKECIKKNRKEKYYADHEKSKRDQREWRRKNADKVKRYKKSYWDRHGEKENRKKRSRYANDPEFRKAKKEYARKWGLENPDRKRKNVKRWKRENRQRWNKIHQQHRWRHIKKYRRIWRVAASKRRAVIASADGDFTVEEWEALKQKHDYTCLCCHQREPEIDLTIDHVIPLSLGGSNYIENIQPLCGICNSTKNANAIDYRIDRERPRVEIEIYGENDDLIL